MSSQKLFDQLRSGERDLYDYLVALCTTIEGNEDHIQALIPETYSREKILEQANRLLEIYPDPKKRPPLFGVPVGVKDIFRVDGFPTQCGSGLPAHLFEGPEAECVTQLKQAGAIIIAKTVTTEFAYFEPGPTRNPRQLEHTPGGSSSGSAAGVACDDFPLALGTQTVGSVIRPAAYCGVIGFKPSAGRISKEGVIPFSPTADTVGLFCKDIEGIELCLSILDPGWQSEASFNQPVCGVPIGPYLDQASDEMRQHFDAQVEYLSAKGFHIKKIPMFENFETIHDHHHWMTAAEKARVHATWFEAHKDLYRPRTRAWIEKGQTIDDDTLQQYQQEGLQLRADIEQTMQATNIDCWICPSTLDTPPKGLDSTGSPAMNLPWTSAGLPAISLPSGKNETGLPFGLQVISGFDQDASLLSISKKLLPYLSTA